jgi:hypothetical protein
LHQNLTWERSRSPSQKPLTLKPGKPPLWIVPISKHGFQPGHRTPPIQDEDGFAVLHLIHERAQVILSLGQSGSLHLARIANSPLQLKRSPVAILLCRFAVLWAEMPGVAAPLVKIGWPAAAVD